MSTPGHPGPRPPEELTPRSWSRSGLALLAGVGIVALYLAGAAVSGRASILARRPLLDGLAPPTPYRWVNPPPDLAASNKPPASTRFNLELAPEGSQLGAFSTSDGQVNLVLSQGAVPPRAGQTGVEVTVDPVDPATLGPVPSGLVGAGNAYRIQAGYQPSGDQGGGPRRSVQRRPRLPPADHRGRRHGRPPGAVVGRRPGLGGRWRAPTPPAPIR